ncbi:MAG: hypothetical protein IJI35_18810, partial [Kiritimatiellae bacterium]|nr:hypothetical protein [Kiritimatiellia bacterium]
MKTSMIPAAALLFAFAGCDPTECARVDTLDAKLWEKSEWISAADAPVFSGESKNKARAADGTSWFVCDIAFDRGVKTAKWMTT